ncbi:MAG: hypothetical protein RML12_03485 [Xanthomonadales bacterium]|nr:hypothetical protein [Xanthomonadales bacterium]
MSAFEAALNAFDTVRSIKVQLAVAKPAAVGSGAVSVFLDELSLLETAQAGHHLSGSWYNPAWNGQGFFLDLANTTRAFDLPVFFGGWFTWTTTPGQRNWWTVQGQVRADRVSFSVFETRDGLFLDPRPVTNHAIGSGSIRFLSCTQAEVQIQLDGQPAQSFPLARLTPVPAGCANFFP